MPQTKPILAAILLALSSAATAAGHDHGAHVHGEARLEVAVDGKAISLRLESPLANLLGFEHAPNTDRQRAQAKALLAELRRGDQLFVPTPAAACRLAAAEIEAPMLEGQAAGAGHGDLDVDYRFECARPEALKGLDVRLFGAYKGLARIDAAVVTAKGQQAYTLTRRLHFMAW